LYADLSTVSSPTDAANRVLQASAHALSGPRVGFTANVMSRVRARLELVPDPLRGLAIPCVAASHRSLGAEEQLAALDATLPPRNAMAMERGATLGIVLDEFHQIHRLGGDRAEWRLKEAMQNHQHLSYVLASSEAGL